MGSERFNEYVQGMQFTLHTDHKPLVPLLTSKELAKLPPRIQRFRLRLARYSPEVIHVPGKSQIIADALSRAPSCSHNKEDVLFCEEVHAMSEQAFVSLPATLSKIQEIIEHQNADPEISEVRRYCATEWPTFMPANTLLTPYWNNKHHLTIVNDLLMYDNRIVIPRELRLETLDKLHESHLGISKCKALAQTSV